MPNDQHELTHINWSECFGFTKIFRTFRLAIQPGRMTLALLAIVLVCLCGWLMDNIWLTGNHGAVRGELLLYLNGEELPGTTTQGERGDYVGVFSMWLSQERWYLQQAVDSARHLNFFRGFACDYSNLPGAVGRGAMPSGGPNGVGVAVFIVLMMKTVLWMLAWHWFYALIFLLLSLVIWSVFGGAICRMAAVEFARDEKVPMLKALKFSKQKFTSFFSAPLVPLILILVIGLFLYVGGLIGAIPGVGEVVSGVFFFLALIGGFLATVVTVGALAGGSLFWPTIAVEGSDSFDAMSRSYSYVGSRPWRSLLYGLVAVVYGSVCWLFLRVFVWLMMLITHWFVGFGMNIARRGPGDALGKLDAMWPTPQFGRLYQAGNDAVLQGAEGFGAWMISLWVLLLIALFYAFLLSFYFSGSTVIYFLLRREVDDTDPEEVFIEELDEDEPPSTLTEPIAPSPAPSSLSTAVEPPTPSTDDKPPDTTKEDDKSSETDDQ